MIAPVAAAIAFLAFVVGRYISGMTRLRAWELLRGGAGYLMGAALLGVLVFVAAVLDFFGWAIGFSVLALAIPAAMLILGAEMVIGYVLEVYRPRRRGEIVRPAFDSRILGWLTSPESISRIISETLNYQFGFEISRSWFYRLLARAITPLIIIAALVLIALSSIVIVPPQKQAIITTFGAIQGEPAGPGLHFKYPWPIGGAEKYETRRVRSMRLGSVHGGEEPAGGHDHDDHHEGEQPPAALWTNEHAGEERYLLTAPPRVEARDLGVALAAGELIGAEIKLNYTIDNLKQYVTAARKPERMLRAIAEQEIAAYFASRSIGAMLTGGRREAGEALRDAIQARVDERRLGLAVNYVGVLHVHPPQQQQVASAFHEKIGAFQEKQSRIQEARKEAVSILAGVAGSKARALEISQARSKLSRLETRAGQLEQQLERDVLSAIDPMRMPDASLRADQLGVTFRALVAAEQAVTEHRVRVETLIEEAGGEASQILAEARAYRWRRPLTEAGKAERFAAQLAAYRQAPRYYRMRQYLQVLGQSLKEPRKIIMTAETQVPPTIRLQLESAQAGLESILGEGEQ